MKKYSHAWIAFMAIKRLKAIGTLPIVDAKGAEGLRKDARDLVSWFMNYRDFVIKGSWYPDEVFKDMGTSHILKYKPYQQGDKTCYTEFKPLPDTMQCYAIARGSYLFNQPYSIEDGNLADRCESLAHGLVDSFKILHNEEKGNPICPSNNHVAARFFILSHYIADAHMPLHCDVRPFSDGKKLHAAIEKNWDDAIRASYLLDTDNERFFYDIDGFPYPDETLVPWIREVADSVLTRPYVHSWGAANKKNGALRDNASTWDYMSAVTEYSYLLSYLMIPAGRDNSLGWADYRRLPESARFEEYSKAIFTDAIDSVARIWLHAWIRYRRWVEGRFKKA